MRGYAQFNKYTHTHTHMEGTLWRETLSRSLGSHDAAELVDGMCHGNGCQQETTRLHAISYTKTGWSSLTHNPVLHQALARSLRESKVQYVVEYTWPFRERASGQHGRLNPLRMDITTEAGALFDNHPQLKNKALLLDITIVNPCASSNLGNATNTKTTGTHIFPKSNMPIITPLARQQVSLPMKYISDAYHASLSPFSTAPTAEPIRASTATISPIATLPENGNNAPTSSCKNSTPSQSLV